MNECQKRGHRNLQHVCKDCGIVVCEKKMGDPWLRFELRSYSPFNKIEAPYDGKPFIACIWGKLVGQAVYARHNDAGEDRISGKYEFFYITQNPEKEGWEVKIEESPFPITHWMPLPEPPK